MSCRICGRSSCTESFHSLEEQEEYEAELALKDQVRQLEKKLSEQDAEINDAINEVEKLSTKAEGEL